MDYVCWDCGSKEVTHCPSKEVFTEISFERFPSRWYCESCYEKKCAEQKRDLQQYIVLKTKLMIERAIRMFESQNADVYEYREAIATVSEFVAENPEKFMSAHEVLAAIVLADNEIEIHVQHPIAGHKVDFYLPSMRVVLEVDGYMHKYHKNRDSRRDVKIKATLGNGWEIVRIPTQYIEQNAELLVEAIRTIKEEKRKKRV